MPKYEVEITDTVTRSTTIIVEAADSDSAILQVRDLFFGSTVAADVLLNRLAQDIDDIDTVFDAFQVDDDAPLTDLT